MRRQGGRGVKALGASGGGCVILFDCPDVNAVVASMGIAAVSDDDLVALCQELLAANPKIVADVKGGKEQAAAGLIGQAKKKNPNANPGKVRQMCLDLIKALP